MTSSIDNGDTNNDGIDNDGTDHAPGNDILATDGEIARYFLGQDTAKNRGRVRALMCQIMPVEHRMPSCIMGGQRTSFKSWINRWINECRAREQLRAKETAAAKRKVEEVAAVRAQRRPRGKPTHRQSATVGQAKNLVVG